MFVLLSNTVLIFGPKVLGMAIDDLGHGLAAHGILWYIGLLLAIEVVQGASRFAQRRVLIGVSRRVERDLRALFYDHLLDLPRRFYAARLTGDIMSRATQDIENVRRAIGPALMYSVDTQFRGLWGLGMMIWISPRLTLIVAILLPLIIILVYQLSHHIHRLTMESQKQFGRISSRVQEAVSGMRVIQAYTREDHQSRVFRRDLELYRRIQMRMVRLQAAFRPTLGLLFTLGQGLILWQAGTLIIEGRMSLGDYVAYAAYLSMLSWPMVAVGWSMNLFQRGDAGMRRLGEILDHEDRTRGGEHREELRGELVFENLGFRYPGGGEVLEGIDLRVPAGRVLGIVGPTGSGKSSLLSLVTRINDPTAGRILLDGRDLRDYDLDSLRRQVAAVPQEAFLFSDTLRGNVKFGRPAADDEEMEHVARVSRLDQDLSLFSAGWESLVGERGITLSGGQKQRSTIARALLMDARVLVLDDCLSAVDTRTEDAMIERLRRFLRGRTALVASHRLSVMHSADWIIVLDEGRIIEQGTHEQLLLEGGFYAELFSKQQLEEELGVDG